MCGIIGYIGDKKAQPILLNSLAKLEYRGYDSCGIALDNKGLQVFKDVGRVSALVKQLQPHDGKTGIGHTRWATHGEPSKKNSHPHVDCAGKIAVVHNGTITNFQELRTRLQKEGHELVSDTDTEILPHLIEQYYQGDLVAAVEKALSFVQGAYTMIAMVSGGDTLVAARNESPLIIGLGDRENFIASDVPALLDYTSRVIYLEDGDIAAVSAHKVQVRRNGAPIRREEHRVDWNLEDAQKGGYEHFMLKEIHEEPKVIRDTLAEYLGAKEPATALGDIGGSLEDILILACGTSYHAGMIGKYIFEKLLNVPVRAEIADEFSYGGQASAKNKAVIITQSGETRDVLKALKRLTENGARTIGITNVVGSSITRAVDRTLYTRAGPEISVASTKAFIAQLIALYWLAIPFARVDSGGFDHLVAELRQLPAKVQQVLEKEEHIAEIAAALKDYENVFFIGKGINYPVALEGALKLKEISYIHAEGYAAGELKHGPFALLGEKTPVVAIVAPDDTYDAMITSLKEIKARRSPLIVIAPESDDAAAALADYVITTPDIDPLFSPVTNSTVLQLLAYYTAKERGCPIDFPRNLAKSVTVE